MRRALSGLSVVELPSDIAGSYCSKLFADLGADVVKVHGWHRGDDLPHAGLRANLDTNKRGLAFDDGDDQHRQMLGTLVAQADLVVESDLANLEAWGFRREPSTSVVHISGFGATGPYSTYKWDDLVVQAVSGFLLYQNHPDYDPLRLPAHLALCFVGSVAALGGLSAVMRAERGEGGSFVDCSAVEALASVPMRQAYLLGYQYRGRVPPPPEALSYSTLIPSGVFPCADGHVALMSTAQQLKEMLQVLGDPDATAAFEHPDAFDRPETKEVLDVALYSWLLTHTRAEATAEAQKAGWPLAGVNDAGEVLDADHLHQRSFWIHTDDPHLGSIDLPGPWCRFGEGGWALRRLAPSPGSPEAVWDPKPPRLREGVAATTRPPLDGIRVVDLTQVWSGPYATMLLADLGAEVIRVENPFVLPPTTKGYHPRPQLNNPGMLGSLYGQPRPGAPDRPWNRHAMNNSIARNKVSVTIDTRRPEGRELVMQLAERSDVFIDNFKSNGLQRIGLEISELRQRNPDLILVRMPPAGLTGDWSDYTGFGAQFDALTGLLSICGHLGSDPTATPATTYMDAASGPAGALAVMAALRYRSATGRGQFVELSQSENVINHLGDLFVDRQMGVERKRVGNRHEWRAPQGLYRCRGENRWLAVSVGDDEQWRSFAGVIGRPALGDDPRFADATSRRANHDELDRVISAWTAEQDALDAFHVLQSAGVPAGPLLDDELFTDDPNMRERGWFGELESRDVGVHLHAGHAFAGIPQVWRRGSPTLGEDNEYVYKKILGVTDEQYRRFEEEKMLATDYLMPDGTPY